MIEDEDGKKVPAPDSVAYWANQDGVNVAAAEGSAQQADAVFSTALTSCKGTRTTRTAPNSLSNVIEALKAGQARHPLLWRL